MARGSLKQRSAGTWYLRVELEADPATGKRRQKAATFRGTKKAADAELARLVLAADAGAVGATGRLTVAQFLARWLAVHARPNLAPKTYANYVALVDNQIVPVLGGVLLEKLRPAHVVQFVSALRAMSAKAGRRGKPTTDTARLLSVVRQRQAFVVLKAALQHAVRWTLIPSNPLDAVDAPTVRAVEIHPWNAAQATAFLAASADRGLAWQAFFATAVLTGMRLAELVGLRWADVDLDARTLRVEQTIAHVTGVGEVVKPPKTKAGRRTLPVGPDLVALLRRHKATQTMERHRLGDAWRDRDLVFPSAVGTPLGPHRARRELAATAAVAGVPVIRLHGLRHTAATLMLLVNHEPVKVVSERLGHASVLITLAIYGHVLPGMQETAAVALEDLLRARRDQSVISDAASGS